jgi:hypothetical protein
MIGFFIEPVQLQVSIDFLQVRQFEAEFRGRFVPVKPVFGA